MIVALAYLLIAVTGVSFGLVGAGGAILIIPILTYMLGLPASQSTTLSLPMSIMVSAVGGGIGIKRKQIDWKQVLGLGLPTAIFAFIARKILVPALPEGIGGIPKNSVLMIGLALILLAAGVLMVRGIHYAPRPNPRPVFGFMLGALVGVLSGFFGIGGGFLIVPILVLGYGLDMKVAVPTSLVCVVLITGLAFAASLTQENAFDWARLAGLMAAAGVGMIAGSQLREKVDSDRLKSGFGCLLLAVAVFVFVQEFALRRPA